MLTNDDGREVEIALRPYEPEHDLPHVAVLLSAVEATDQDGENASEETLREQLAWPNHNPPQDCRVVDGSHPRDGIIGYGSVFAQTPIRSTLYVAVHPEHRRQGIGHALLTQALARVEETGAQQALVYANARNAASATFLRHHTFAPVSSAWTLQAAKGVMIEPVVVPAGYSLRSYATVQDRDVLVAVKNRCYADMWGHAENEQPATIVDVDEWLETSEASGIFLVFAPGGDAVGLCQAIRGQGDDTTGDPVTDYIDAPAVAPHERDSGLHRPLLLAALHWLREQADRTVEMQSWGDDENTVDIYANAAFRVMQQYVAYVRNLA